MEAVLWLIGLALVLSGPAALIMAMSQTSKLRGLDIRLASLDRTFAKLQNQISALQSAIITPTDAQQRPSENLETEVEGRSDEVQEHELAPEPVARTVDTAEGEPKQETVQSTKPLLAPPTSETSKKTGAFETFEDDLSAKWMVWLGGIALALGGGFIVKYSIDAGLLGPTARVIAGSFVGLILLAAGEFIRQRKSQVDWLTEAPDYIPQALAGAGLFTLFAAILAAYSLYDLMSPLIAFVLLALVSFGATVLAQVQGRLFAYLGVVAGLLVPILVSTGEGNPWLLFPYLLLVVSGGLFAARACQWVDVAGASIGLALLWVPIWIVSNWHTGDSLPAGLFILALTAFAAFLLNGATPRRSTAAQVSGMFPIHGISLVADIVHMSAAVLFVCMVRLEHYSAESIAMFATYVAGIGYLATRDAEYDLPALFAALAGLFLLSIWHVPDLVEIETVLFTNDPSHLAIAPIAPPGFAGFVTAGVLLAGGMGLFAYLLLPILLRKSLWAAVGAAYPALALIVLYGRLNDFETSLPFSAIAIAVSGLMALAVFGAARTPEIKRATIIAAYACGASACAALALAMALRDSWLSFAISLEVAALAYIWRATGIHILRQLATLAAAIVLVRLFANAAIFEYDAGSPLPPINWLFYGYGLTALLFAWSARIFGKDGKADRLYSLLVAGSVLLGIGFITLEIHVLANASGSLAGEPSQLEYALQTINWSFATTLLLWREVKSDDPLFKGLRKVMTFASVTLFLFTGGLYNNIFVNSANGLGTIPVFNVQLLQYFIPALLFATKAWLAEGEAYRASRKLYGIVALLSLFIWISAEVKLYFATSYAGSGTSEWEIYSYSIFWLIYAVALIVVGLRRHQQDIRLAGLGLLAIVTLKVFLGDLGNLEGIARALSFMGLGLALIGLGYLYRQLKPRPVTRNAAA